MRPYFFLSYSHGDQADDERVGRFFTDLSTEIRALTGDDHDEVVGFHDFRTLRAGMTWTRELIEALSTARTFVALCSPRYFRSSFCGKEWAVYAQRVARHEHATGERPPWIIPVFWVWTEIPAELGDIHHRDPLFSERYQSEGLRELMRLDLAHEYGTFVRALALRIRQIANGYPLPEPQVRSDFRAVPSAFPGPAELAAKPNGDHRATADPRLNPEALPSPEPQPRDRPIPPRPILRLEPGDSAEQQ